ncbi:ABC transporter permease [Streptomyces lichenis]|uniref:ABC transporter permease n=1 Tax=Streptomyces lichenis TaxID=2306967 RepID=A0ABT0IJQ9_9ACTN|nr:ABC transporter permease [Streptomyces lichenis]MCK8681575.1 ABC transporter permease [Streptomyces lichenis]
MSAVGLDTRTSRPLLSGLPRLVLRQHRWALWTLVACVVLVAGALVVTRLWREGAADAWSAAGCTEANTRPRCFQPRSDLAEASSAAYAVLVNASVALVALPGVVAAFAAGPLVARELEAGTYKLAWSQSVTPTRWLAAKLAVPLAASATATAVLLPFFAWARLARQTDFSHYTRWWDPTTYATSGLLPVALTVMGLAVGTLAGLLVRRTVPAMAVAALAVGAVMLALYQAHPWLWPSRTVTGREAVGLGSGAAWPVQDGMLTASGERITRETCFTAPESSEACMQARGGVTYFVDYHPASHYWPLQLVESGILLALAALAVAGAFRVLRRLHG